MLEIESNWRTVVTLHCIWLHCHGVSCLVYSIERRQEKREREILFNCYCMPKVGVRTDGGEKRKKEKFVAKSFSFPSHVQCVGLHAAEGTRTCMAERDE